MRPHAKLSDRELWRQMYPFRGPRPLTEPEAAERDALNAEWLARIREQRALGPVRGPRTASEYVEQAYAYWGGQDDARADPLRLSAADVATISAAVQPGMQAELRRLKDEIWGELWCLTEARLNAMDKRLETIVETDEFRARAREIAFEELDRCVADRVFAMGLGGKSGAQA